MAADAVTLASITDVSNFRRFYLVQSSTLNPPVVPTTNPPPGSWGTVEPTYTAGATTSLYTVDLVVFSDATFDYLPVQLSSSYEAAKQAWNKAEAAALAASQALVSANGRNSRIRSLSDATGTTNPDTGLPLVKGDTWWRMDKLTAGGRVTGQWGWSGTAWVAELISHETIASVDLNTLLVTGDARMNLAVVERIVGDAGFYKLLTADKFASLDPGDGIYPDGNFKDPGLTAVRASNTGMTVAGGGLQGQPPRVSLTARGVDEGETIPLTPNELYSVQVWGVGLTTGWTLAIKHSNGVITNLPTVREGSTRLAASAVPTSAGARLILNRTGTITITRVEVRHGIGGTLIAGGSVDTNHLKTTALDFWKATGMELTSPKLQTNPAANRGMKMIEDRFTGYSPTGQLQIDIGGPEGIIKGVTLEGVSVNGGSFKTNAGTDGYVDIRSYGATHSVKAVGTEGRRAFSLSGVTGPEEYGILQLFSTTQGRELYATAQMLAFRDSNGTGQETLEIQNNAIGPSIQSRKKPLYLSSSYGVYINQVDVAGREVEALSSNMSLVRQGRTRQVRVLTNANLPEGNTSIFGTVPAADRPDANVFGTAYFAGFLGGAFVGADGVVWITNRSGATRTAVQATINWTI